MPDYDFRSLSSHDFELLVRDLLQAELKVRLESFSPGRDGGIDFRFKNVRGDLVIQCKHYADYDELFRILSREEVKKVRRLQPERYILVVSTPLTLHRKEALLTLFTPFCQATKDIYGREDLNNLLGDYSEIEKKNFKLWLTSDAVLTHVLQAGIWGDAELTLERIRRRASRYVPNPSLDRAKQILDEHHYCIIAGIPGIGKTTLAEILLVEYVDRHGFQAIRIANDLSEIKAVKRPKQRQIFYFDDFLGTRALDKLEKNEDKRLIEFIEEVSGNKNWRFVLTTREYILNAAKQKFEAFCYPAIPLKPCIVELSDYTPPIRGRILYNHIYFSDLANTYKLALLNSRRYKNILSHPNYNPRIIEYMTLARNAELAGSGQYYDDFIANLDNPTRVWDHAFRNQLSEASQHLLLVLGTLAEEVLLSDLEIAFNSFYQYRRKKLGFNTSSRDFEYSLKELDGNFINTSLVGRDQIVAFHNPSVGDFIDSYLTGSLQDLGDLIESAEFFDQFQNAWKRRPRRSSGGFDVFTSKFVLRLGEQFSAQRSELVRVGSGPKNISGMRHWDISFENKTAFAVEVALELNTPEALSAATKLLEEVERRLQQGIGDKHGLLSLMQSLKPPKKLAMSHVFFQEARAFLSRNLDDVSDFNIVRELMGSFPEAIEGENLQIIRREFEEFCETFDSRWLEEPDDLLRAARDLEQMGARLEVKTTKVCADLKRRAADRERQLGEGDDGEGEPDEDWRERQHTAEDIDLMFDCLLGEINERYD